MKKTSIIVISMLIAVISCKKDSDDSTSPAANNSSSITVNSTQQVSFKLDGVAKSYVESATIKSVVSSSVSIATFPDTSSKSYGIGFEDMNTSAAIFDLDKGFLRFVGNMPDSDLFYNFYVPSSPSFVIDPDVSMGVRLAYYINGVKWSTDQGTGIQTGGSFSITARKKSHDWFGEVSTIILANFNCKLYDGLGNSKTITDGVIVCTFQNI